jgi:hypothetical protein
VRGLQTMLVLAAMVGMAGLVLIGVRARPAPAAPAVETATPALETTTPRPWVPPASVVGFWQRRDALLVIAPNGRARFAWRTDWCSADVPPPCDRQQNDTLILGAHADLILSQVERESPLTVLGRVDEVNMPGVLEIGPITLLWPSSDLVELRQAGRVIELCRPPREPHFCDLTADQLARPA